MIETFNERDKLLKEYRYYREFYDDLKEKIDATLKTKTVLNSVFYKYSFENYFGGVSTHPEINNLYSMNVMNNLTMESITLMKDELVYLTYGLDNDINEHVFAVCTSKWVLTEKDIYLSTSSEIEEEVKNNPFYPKRYIEWNDNHHMMYKLSYE